VEFPEEFSRFAKGSKFNTRTKTIIEAMARDDRRDGTQGGEGRDRQGDSLFKRLVAHIWHVLSYHSISKLPVWHGMVWYGRRSAEMPVAIAEDSDDSLRMLSMNGTDSTMLPLPPSRASLQPLFLICLGN
jgi:hypothetical protein